MKSQIVINNKYGRLTVLKNTGHQNGHLLFECFCECGVLVKVKGIHLKNGHTKSCGCFMKEETSRRNLAKGKKDKTFYFYTRNAKRRNIIFNLTEDKFNSIRKKKCFYCKVDGPHGVDRVDNNKGYTIDNSVPCCKICNRAKGTLSLKDFKIWLTRIKELKNGSEPA